MNVMMEVLVGMCGDGGGRDLGGESEVMAGHLVLMTRG